MDNQYQQILNASALKARRKELRQRQTFPEEHVWNMLRNKQLNGYKFHRQYSIGPCVVDFCCPKKKLVIEIDGEYHDDPEQQMQDRERETYLVDRDFSVIRFKNQEVIDNPLEVKQNILKYLM
ncbi:MAG: endonuclease domain-containing protein [Patescibacteria group bacterium]